MMKFNGIIILSLQADVFFLNLLNSDFLVI